MRKKKENLRDRFSLAKRAPVSGELELARGARTPSVSKHLTLARRPEQGRSSGTSRLPSRELARCRARDLAGAAVGAGGTRMLACSLTPAALALFMHSPA
jgi:hypothetical protein